jgi:hypothetical protein
VRGRRPRGRGRGGVSGARHSPAGETGRCCKKIAINHVYCLAIK